MTGFFAVAQGDAGAILVSMMQLVDPFGRTATDLRVSVTDLSLIHI